MHVYIYDVLSRNNNDDDDADDDVDDSLVESVT